jgi:antitoxin (DNA-binding transcriptional repressor) of toxin-antitoxin stability system
MLFLKEYLKVVVMVERFVGLEEARPVLGQLAEEAATGDEVWLTKHGKPMAVKRTFSSGRPRRGPAGKSWRPGSPRPAAR